MTKRAFTLVEILIVVSILGILAAIVLPQYQSHAQAARESAAKENLRILRNAIEFYAAEHGDRPPGYTLGFTIPGLMIPNQFIFYTNAAGTVGYAPSTDFPYGPYLKKMPENPFNNRATIYSLNDTESFYDGGRPTGYYGWIYNPATKEIRLDYAGTDSDGVSYYDY